MNTCNMCGRPISIGWLCGKAKCKKVPIERDQDSGQEQAEEGKEGQ